MKHYPHVSPFWYSGANLTHVIKVSLKPYCNRSESPCNTRWFLCQRHHALMKNSGAYQSCISYVWSNMPQCYITRDMLEQHLSCVLYRSMWCTSHNKFHNVCTMTSSNGNNWPSVWGIHRSPVNSPHKGHWRGALMFSLIYAWINGWVKNVKLAIWHTAVLVMTSL